MKLSRLFLQLMLCFLSGFLGYESGSKIKLRTLICIADFRFCTRKSKVVQFFGDAFFGDAYLSVMNLDLKSNWQFLLSQLKLLSECFSVFLICVLFDVKHQSSFWFNIFTIFLSSPRVFFLFFTWWMFNFASWLLKMLLYIFGLIFWLRLSLSFKLFGLFAAAPFEFWRCLSFGYESWPEIKLTILSVFRISCFCISCFKN